MSTTLTVWKVIKLGTFSNMESLVQALVNNQFRIGDWARDVLNSGAFTVSEREREVSLVRLTAKDLGFPEGAYRVDIYKKAQEMDLKLCSLEVGPQLRLQYTDQPYLESLQIGMEPQKDLEGHESEFRVVHAVDYHPWLVGDHKHPDDFWGPNEYFIFVKS